MGKRKDSYCTDKHWWKTLDPEDFEDKCLKDFCIREETGKMCRKAIAQTITDSKWHSSAELACIAILFRPLDTLTEDERKAFNLAYQMGRANYDKQLNALLLQDSRFANNAKIIVILRKFENEGGDIDELKKKMVLNISLRKEE
jgi:hypothetical protein